ncbi:MAG: MFS transporter [Eubacterium sp.]|nr:MFS transporter [Eubacterium sp.]
MASLLLAIIYLIFISLGLPDALLGSVWPSMVGEFGVPLSYAGIISGLISAMTVISSLQSDRLTRRFGTGIVTAASVALTAIALFGFSISGEFWMLCVWAIPYGLGAGSVDASINNYVAIHYESRHMSWLHCMWGVGISIGPYIMSFALTNGMAWNNGYLVISIIQVVLTLIIVFSLPLWKRRRSTPASTPETVTPAAADATGRALKLSEVLRIPGAKAVMITFFCYCAIEQTAILWGASFMSLARDVSAEIAASFASLFCIGITIGRGISGFLTMKFTDTQMVRMGMGIILAGIAFLFLPFGTVPALVGLGLIGFGCAPIYPCVIHSTPVHFGEDRSQAVIGVQMASAYVGTTLMPPLFGVIANLLTIQLLPVYLILILVGMFLMYERLLKITASTHE